MPLAEDLSVALASGGIVVASSPRTARALRRIYAAEQRAHGAKVWRSPAIGYCEGWLEELWQQRLRAGDEARLVLSGLQEHQVWAGLIRPSIEGRKLISIDGVAELAQQAYALLCDYDSLDALDREWPGIDAGTFCEWARAFEAQCKKQGWLSRAKLPLVLSQLAFKHSFATAAVVPSRLFLAGFDRIAPGQQRLLSALAKEGCAIQELGNSSPSSPIEALVEAADEEDEISVCAWWARRTLELAAAENKKARVAVIAPGLAHQRGEIERIFRNVLAPESVPVTAAESPLPFEFSLGVPLERAPLARAAVLLLRWMAEPLSRDDLTWLVLSGFLWKDEADWLSASIFDAELKLPGVLPAECSLDLYLVQNGWHGSPALSGLRDRLDAARREWRVAARGAHGFRDWAEAARRVLSAAGWPGARRMSSEGFQLKARWDALLDGIATLSFDGRPAGYTEFLHVLRRQMAQTIFAPQSHDAPVQILGPFEAAGLEFDAIWFLGASEDAWPSPARPHPLLSTVLQREHHMPHAEPNTDWELARLATERLQRSAPRCIFSYPAQEKDRPLRPSTVLVPRPRIVSCAQMRESLAAPAAEEPAGSSAICLDEDRMSGLLWPQDREAGGYDVLKMQAACPFQAFAHFRLRARPLDSVDWGLDARERGTLLHRALEGIWSELKDRDALVAAIQGGNLREMIERWTGQALSRYRRPHAQNKDTGQGGPGGEGQQQESWSEAYLQAERRRVVPLLEGWLTYEAKRAFFSVEHRETPIAASAGDLRLKLRADRIDRMEDGGRLLIDYKTGKASPSAWEGERPDEPQLPLYATFGNVPELRGVLLAQLRAQDLKFTGSLDDTARAAFLELLLRNTQTYSPEQRQQWESVLLVLAAAFLDGDARVAPKRYPKTCEFCALPGLCRVAESQREREDSDENDGD